MKSFRNLSLPSSPPSIQSCPIIDYVIIDPFLGCCESEKPSLGVSSEIFSRERINILSWNHPKKLINKVLISHSVCSNLVHSREPLPSSIFTHKCHYFAYHSHYYVFMPSLAMSQFTKGFHIHYTIGLASCKRGRSQE